MAPLFLRSTVCESAAAGRISKGSTEYAFTDARIVRDDLPAAAAPDVARAIAGHDTGWTRLLLDPHGMLTETDTYTPAEGMRRFLRARDQHCRFPGCRQPMARCELDHNHDYAEGGRTSLGNLSHFCLTHHMLKHPDMPDGHRWTARQRPTGPSNGSVPPDAPTPTHPDDESCSCHRTPRPISRHQG